MNSEESAQEAGLVYVDDQAPGIRRKKIGRKFQYIDAHNKVIDDEKILKRIHSLVIPPAWADVWICSRANGHLQATGRDSRGRKQYRYHPQWRVVRDETKYDRMLKFGEALPKIRKHLQKDLAREGLPQEKILATVIEVMEKTLIRVGNEEYAQENHSYGLTTLRDKHVEIHGSTVEFHFKGKSGVWHDIKMHDRRLAKIIQRCHELPGHELFEYKDEQGEIHAVDSMHVNSYLKTISGEDFTAKDFRTWHGSVLAAESLCTFQDFDSETQGKKNVIAAIECVAERLGNTRAVCRKCYIHPAILECYLNHSLFKKMKIEGLSVETALLNFLSTI